MFSKLENWFSNLRQLAKKDISDLWNNYKGIFILLGAFILTIKFRDILINLIVSNSKKLFQNTQKKSDNLQNQENKNNQEANNLVQDAQNLQKQEDQTSVNDDWYKRK